MSYRETLNHLHRTGNFRAIPHIATGQSSPIDLSQNDYLGLASRRDLQEEFFASERNRSIAMTSSAARLLAAYQEQYFLLEEKLKELYGGREALLFNSGYHANTGLISALASEKGTLIVADKLVHASIIDGITLSKAPFQRFLHNDFNRLETILQKEHEHYERIIVGVEAVYSMDGDRTHLENLIEIKQRYGNIILYVDEAHSFGVIGPQGLGLCRSLEGFNEIDVIIGTFGKACASTGAFAIMDSELRDYAVNRSRSFIFSTAIPPINCAWTRFMIDKITQMDAERTHLAELSQRISQAVGLTDTRYIVPVIVGSAKKALDMSEKLLEFGFKVLPIRTPTVPPGTERLRVSLNAGLAMEQIDNFLKALSEIDENKKDNT